VGFESYNKLGQWCNIHSIIIIKYNVVAVSADNRAHMSLVQSAA